MKRCKIKVLTKYNNLEEINDFFAIKDEDVIKYIDLEKNKMIINMKKNVLERENKDYLFTFDFNMNNINIYIKNLKQSINKRIKTLIIDKNNKSYLVRYKLIDENVINEYFIKY